jgi:hypothetical protein
MQISESALVSEHVTKGKQLNIDVDITQRKLPTMYWIPKLHKIPYKARFIANSTSCTTTKLSVLLTSCLTKIKEHVTRYCEKTYQNSGLNLFWSIKNSNEVLSKIQKRNYLASTISTHDFSTLYTTLPHDLIKDKLTSLIQKTFARENRLYLACNAKHAFFTNEQVGRYTMWTCSEVCEALTFLLDNIFVRYGNAIYRQVIGIPMGTNCAPLVADMFLYCYERDFMLRLNPGSQSEVISAFNDTSRYLDDIFNIDNPYFDNMISSIYPKELKLIKANSSDVSAAFLDLDISIKNGIVSTKIYDKRDDFNFNIVNYPQLDGDVPRATSYGVYISQLIRFARACSSINDFNDRNLIITEKLLKQGYRYNKLRKTFAKFYYRNISLISKYKCTLKTLLRQGISHPEYYGDVIYKLRKITGNANFHTLFSKRIKNFIKKGYDPTILQRTACLVVSPFTVGHHASLFDCAMTGCP